MTHNSVSHSETSLKHAVHGTSETARVLSAEALRSLLDNQFDDVVATLSDLVAIPSVAWPSFDRAQVEKSAEVVAGLARELAFDSVEVLTAHTPDGAPGYPAVVARKEAPAGRPTVVLYAHHDVQPAGDPQLWDTQPFSATVRSDRIYGRGAADDKAGIMVHLTALKLLGERLNVGVVLFFEGEEESGSPSFRDFVTTYREKLAGDVIVVADSSNWATGVPALTVSLRGMVALEFTLTTLDHSVHSGMYGGVVPDATLAMVRLLSTLHTPDGSVAVPGLVSNEVADVDYTEDTVRGDSGALESTELIGHGSLASRLWQQPALTVIGMDIPDVAHSSNTLQASLRAKVSMRLAPGQDASAALDALKKHLEDNTPFGARVEFGAHESGSPWQANTSDPVLEQAQEALSEGFGAHTVHMGLGGSIPFIADLLQVFPDASIVVTGVEDPDSRAHSANESLYLPDFKSAIVSEALFLQSLGALSLGEETPEE